MFTFIIISLLLIVAKQLYINLNMLIASFPTFDNLSKYGDTRQFFQFCSKPAIKINKDVPL